MELVRRGSQGMAARMAQMLLNNRIAELPEQRGQPLQLLDTDGIFGDKSEAALKDFLARGAGISHAPIIDAQVWRQLGLKVELDHKVPLVGQAIGGQCWSAAAAMILGGPMSVTSGRAAFEKRGALKPDLSNMKDFADSLGWRAVMPTTNAVLFAEMMRRRPVWVAGQGQAGNGHIYGHAIVVSALWGDGDPSGTTTLMRINDPWPPGRGQIYDAYFFSNAGTRLPSGIWFRPNVILIPS
jgi:hypothetical protein